MIYVIGVKRVELDAYKWKNVSWTFFDKWKEGRHENAQYINWACFEKAFLGRSFPQELKEAKVWGLLTLKQDCLSVHEYGLKFIQLSFYAPEIVKDMKNNVAGLGRS